MIDILLLLLKPSLLWESDKARYWYLTPLVLVAVIADILAAHTVWALLAGWPRPKEWTISHTFERLCKEQGPDQMLFIEIARKINRLDPKGNHIRAVA